MSLAVCGVRTHRVGIYSRWSHIIDMYINLYLAKTINIGIVVEYAVEETMQGLDILLPDFMNIIYYDESKPIKSSASSPVRPRIH